MDSQTSLTKRDRSEMVKLLGYLQDLLETEIDSNTIPGSRESSNSADAKIVRAARLKWRRAESMVKKLELVGQKAAKNAL